MGHPILDEFARAYELRPDFFRRVQRVVRDEIQPKLEDYDRLVVENADLKAQLADLTDSHDDDRAGKRGRKPKEVSDARLSA